MSRSLLRLPGKLLGQVRLALRDPRRFLENVDQTLHPEKLRQKLLGFEFMPPLQLRIGAAADPTPHVNVLLPKLGLGSLTGGPNTGDHHRLRIGIAGGANSVAGCR